MCGNLIAPIIRIVRNDLDSWLVAIGDAPQPFHLGLSEGVVDHVESVSAERALRHINNYAITWEECRQH